MASTNDGNDLGATNVEQAQQEKRRGGNDDKYEEDYYIELENFPAKKSDVNVKKEAVPEKSTLNPAPAMGQVILKNFQKFYSLGLVFFCVVLVMACIFKRESSASEYNIHPIGAFFLFWFLICWLATMEGGQGCLVGLQPIGKAEYTISHPKTLKNTIIAHEGDNMDRFIVGRQFLVVLVIFLINMCGSALSEADPIGLPDVLNSIFLGNGVALMITTIVLGQLTTQLNAAVCMLDFINNYFMLFTTYVSLFIEASGLLHAVYLVQISFAKLTGQNVESDEPPRSFFANLLFWGRALMSTILLFFALATTIEALLKGQSGMWKGVPIPVSIVIFFSLMCVVGLMDGMQIAAFALINMSENELKSHKVAFSNCQLMFSGTNLQAFLIGRQVFVAALMFIVAKIATISIGEGEKNIFGVSDGIQKFFDTGLLGAIVLTIIGSLIWRIIASSVPLAFMSNPAIYVIIRICLIIEGSGICSAAWVFARIHKALCRFEEDDCYLGGEQDVEEAVTEVTEIDGDENGFLLSMVVSAPQQGMRMSVIPAVSLKAVDPVATSNASVSLRMSLARSSNMRSSCPEARDMRVSMVDMKNLTALSMRKN